MKLIKNLLQCVIIIPDLSICTTITFNHFNSHHKRSYLSSAPLSVRQSRADGLPIHWFSLFLFHFTSDLLCDLFTCWLTKYTHLSWDSTRVVDILCQSDAVSGLAAIRPRHLRARRSIAAIAGIRVDRSSIVTHYHICGINRLAIDDDEIYN